MAALVCIEPEHEPQERNSNVVACDEEPPERVAALFCKYLCKCWRIRKQQRYFAQLGPHLRFDTDRELAERLKDIYEGKKKKR